MEMGGVVYEAVTEDAAVDRIVGRHREGAWHVVELMGSVASARTEVLRRVRDRLPGAVWVDAAGLDGDALVGRIREELGRAGAGEHSRPVIVAQGQRIVGERVRGYPQEVIDRLEREIAEGLGVLVVVEVDWHEERIASRSRLELEVAARGPDPARSAARSREWALQALALEEGGGAPLEVWRQLSRALNHDELELPVEDEEIEADRRASGTSTTSTRTSWRRT
ncbi:hypothetical protein K377_06707 [Streptomyces sp. PsTaAH-137]|nr:hypothetical protein K377_06707 [Streptomyces sp. PsTaAH-137]